MIGSLNGLVRAEAAHRAGTYFFGFCPNHDRYDAPNLVIGQHSTDRVTLQCLYRCAVATIVSAFSATQGLTTHADAFMVVSRPARLTDPVPSPITGGAWDVAQVFDDAVPVSGTASETFLCAVSACDNQVTANTFWHHSHLQCCSIERWSAFLTAARGYGQQLQPLHFSPVGPSVEATRSTWVAPRWIRIMAGGSVELEHPDGSLTTCDDLETALLVRRSTGSAVWSALAALAHILLRPPRATKPTEIAPSGAGESRNHAGFLALRSVATERSAHVLTARGRGPGRETELRLAEPRHG